MSLFPSPIAQPYPPPKSKPTSNRRTIILILAGSGIAVLAVGGFLLYRAGSWFSRHFLNIDQSQATFVSSVEESVYANPAYGVTLRLPGNWRQRAKSPIGHFCILYAPEFGASALFRPQFTTPQQSLDEFANGMIFGLINGARYKLTGQDRLTVNGQPARRISFEYTLTGKPSQMALLVLKKGYYAYLLTIVAPPRDDDSWKNLMDSLDRAVEIK